VVQSHQVVLAACRWLIRRSIAEGSEAISSPDFVKLSISHAKRDGLEILWP